MNLFSSHDAMLAVVYAMPNANPSVRPSVWPNVQLLDLLYNISTTNRNNGVWALHSWAPSTRLFIRYHWLSSRPPQSQSTIILVLAGSWDLISLLILLFLYTWNGRSLKKLGLRCFKLDCVKPRALIFQFSGRGVGIVWNTIVVRWLSFSVGLIRYFLFWLYGVHSFCTGDGFT